MLLTPKTEKALQKAAILHDGQYRKGTLKLPYIVHPFVVGVLLSKYSSDENVITAGLLHDVLEDTPYTAKEMSDEFGAEVAEIVLGVTETKKRDGVKLPWRERKESYLKALGKARYESLLVAAADKIHNLQSMLSEEGAREEVFSSSNKISADDYLWYYGEVKQIFQKRLKEYDLLNEFVEVYQQARQILGAQ